MRTCIISGGMIEPDFAFPYLQKQQFDIILAADRGLEFCYHYQIMPTYILGDFDSLSPEILNYYKENHVAPIREFNPMKDNTDTDIAFQQAIVLGSSEITILGATGGRLDHFLSIVQNLKTAWEKKIPAYIVDSRLRFRWKLRLKSGKKSSSESTFRSSRWKRKSHPSPWRASPTRSTITICRILRVVCA